MMFDNLVGYIRDTYRTNAFIPLHAPIFSGHEKKYVLDAIDSTFVSSVGAYVDKFEHDIALYTNSPSAVVTVNGTSALHTALMLSGVKANDYVMTQSLTFVATCNAITYCQAEPIFIDVDKHTLGLSPSALDAWLHEFAYIDDDNSCRYSKDQRIIRACVPMHTFGHPVDLDALIDVCNRWHLLMIEDAAESLGSLYKNKHTGTFGASGILSFNGNKIMTTGGGGVILSNQELGRRAKHITTTAKLPHPYEYQHDEVAFNYRMPNINAALGCAQLEQLNGFIEQKRILAKGYETFFKNSELQFFSEPMHCRSNYWLNAILCEDKTQRDALLKFTNDHGIMTRPVWHSMHHLPMFKSAPKGTLDNAQWLEDRIVNIPSSVIGKGSLNA